MGIYVNVGGTWKDMSVSGDGPRINVAGTWKTPDEVHINVAGTWKKVWPAYAITVNITNHTSTVLGGGFGAYNYFALLNTGASLDMNGTPISGEYLSAGSANDAEAYVSYTGTTPTSGTYNSWLPLTTSRTFRLDMTGYSYGYTTFTVQIRDAATTTVLGSADIILESDDTP